MFVPFFLNLNRRSLQQPQLDAIIRPALQNKAAFWIDLVQAVFAPVVIISHYADDPNLTAMLRILVIDFWAAALAVTTAYYVIYPAELRRR